MNDLTHRNPLSLPCQLAEIHRFTGFLRENGPRFPSNRAPTMTSRCLTPVFVLTLLCGAAWAAEKPADRPVTTIDLNDQTDRQVVVDREPGQYLGHPTTLLLEDGKTILCVYPKSHGRGAIVYKRSRDGGLTWSDRLPTPASWATSKEVPTLHRVIDPQGKKRIIMWSGLYPARLAVSEDDRRTLERAETSGRLGRRRRDGVCRASEDRQRALHGDVPRRRPIHQRRPG